jgi:hypothetical protein
MKKLWVLTFRWLDLKEPVQDSLDIFESLEEAMAHRDKLIADQAGFARVDPASL